MHYNQVKTHMYMFTTTDRSFPPIMLVEELMLKTHHPMVSKDWKMPYFSIQWNNPIALRKAKNCMEFWSFWVQ